MHVFSDANIGVRGREDAVHLRRQHLLRRGHGVRGCDEGVSIPEHVQEAVPGLSHAVIVHLGGDQAGVIVGDFEWREGGAVGEPQQPRSAHTDTVTTGERQQQMLLVIDYK